ncbi:S9 family peptidase [Caulobacter sp. RHG1]|uniref:alpha/beta hydrolase family protein n=1 Tax=Caulobacter sp. (strain RHG1) TaxID=2545762 RepID=UPI001555D8CA|nr:S9 family peptidase [Caulobacter sp. RHG1]NQE62985.1 Prolyl oligopeptidase family protein [Caulobacter sp. RHG1]
MIQFCRSALSGLAALAFAGAAQAAESPAAKAFGARESVLDASLSPDGKSIAMIQPLAGGQASVLVVAPADGSSQPKPIFSATGKPDRLTGCGWVSNVRLVCDIYMVSLQDARKLVFTRVVALNADGGDVRELSATSNNTVLEYQQFGGDVIDWLVDEPAGGSVMMTRRYREEATTGTLLANTRRGLAVEKVDTSTLQRVSVEPPRPDVARYISDQHGVVRIYGQRSKTNVGYDTDRVNYFYRPADGGAWAPLSSYDGDARTGFVPTDVDQGLNAAYGFEWADGRRVALRVALDGSGKREVLLAHDAVDVDRLIRVGRQRRVVGASYATERRHVEFFDPALKAMAAALSKALNQPMIRFLDASQDGSRLLLWAGADVEPGRYYLYDKSAKRLAEVTPGRPELAGYKLSPVKPVSYKAADGTDIPAYLTLPLGSDGKNIPAIVMPHGGPESRDEWGFDWLAQYFAQRGFAVLQPNFRGSAGYGEAWFQKNGFQSWRTAIGDVVDAGRWLSTQGIAAPGKLAIVGWSYGGYAALQSSVLDANLFKAIVAIAPVTDLDALREESRAFTSFKRVDGYIGRGPHVKEGSPAQNAGLIKAPVLMFHGDQDMNVSIAESRLMQSRLKAAGGKSELVVYPGLDHQLDDSQARAQMLDKADAFLREALKL